MQRNSEIQDVLTVWENVREGRNLPLELDFYATVPNRFADKSITAKNYSDWRIERAGVSLHQSFGFSTSGWSVPEVLRCGLEINEAMKEASLRQRPFLFEATHFSKMGQVAITWVFLPLRDCAAIPFANTFYILRSFNGSIPLWHGEYPLKGIMSSSIKYVSELELSNVMGKSGVERQRRVDAWVQRGKFLVLEGGKSNNKARAQ